jgi:tetratricopeptide (TPR) repeat protein
LTMRRTVDDGALSRQISIGNFGFESRRALQRFMSKNSEAIVCRNSAHEILTGVQIFSFASRDEIVATAISNGASRLVLGFATGKVKIIDLPTIKSETWIPAARARSFYGLSVEDKNLIGSNDQWDDTELTARADECDLLGGDPFDPHKVSLGVVGPINLERAIPSCREAVKARPEQPRFAYQLGRLLVANNNAEEAVPYFQKAIDAKYPAALYRLATIYQKGIKGSKSDPSKAFELYSRAFESGLSAAGQALGQMLWDRSGRSKS